MSFIVCLFYSQNLTQRKCSVRQSRKKRSAVQMTDEFIQDFSLYLKESKMFKISYGDFDRGCELRSFSPVISDLTKSEFK